MIADILSNLEAMTFLPEPEWLNRYHQEYARQEIPDNHNAGFMLALTHGGVLIRGWSNNLRYHANEDQNWLPLLILSYPQGTNEPNGVAHSSANEALFEKDAIDTYRAWQKVAKGKGVHLFIEPLFQWEVNANPQKIGYWSPKRFAAPVVTPAIPSVFDKVGQTPQYNQNTQHSQQQPVSAYNAPVQLPPNYASQQAPMSPQQAPMLQQPMYQQQAQFPQAPQYSQAPQYQSAPQFQQFQYPQAPFQQQGYGAQSSGYDSYSMPSYNGGLPVGNFNPNGMSVPFTQNGGTPQVLPQNLAQMNAAMNGAIGNSVLPQVLSKPEAKRNFLGSVMKTLGKMDIDKASQALIARANGLGKKKA